MITPEQAGEQIDRMYGLKNFPRGEQGAAMHKDLVKEIGQAKDLPEAELIIGEFLEEATPDTPCPLASQIRKAITSRLDEFRPDPDCKQCDGNGQYEVIRNGKPSGGWDRCNCWARRPAPVYHRNPTVVGQMMGQVEKIAAAKRNGGEG